jgi:hypothetical protein
LDGLVFPTAQNQNELTSSPERDSEQPRGVILASNRNHRKSTREYGRHISEKNHIRRRTEGCAAADCMSQSNHYAAAAHLSAPMASAFRGCPNLVTRVKVGSRVIWPVRWPACGCFHICRVRILRFRPSSFVIWRCERIDGFRTAGTRPSTSVFI